MHVRISSQYVPLKDEEIIPRLASSFSIEGQARFVQLLREVSAIPRTSGYFQDSQATCSGKFLFLGIQNKEGWPIARADCLIINMRHKKKRGRREKVQRDYDYGLILDLVVLPEYRRQGVARTLVNDLVKRMNYPDILMAACVQKLAYLQVAMSSHLTPCRRIFEACGFNLVSTNGESVYQHSLEVLRPDDE